MLMLPEVFGISEVSALTIMSEVGTDMTKWKNRSSFYIMAWD